jgi:GT2 family glycosyltransferase
MIGPRPLSGPRPDVSVVVCAYNSRRDLERLMPTLDRQRDVTLNVIVVDNHSRDGTQAWLADRYPSVRYLRAGQNQGYGWANNWGLRVADGRYVLVLNPDTELEPRAVREMVRVAERHPRSLVTAKLLLEDGRVNACGLVMHYTGLAFCQGLGEDPQDFRGEFPVPLVSGAAVLASRDTWKDLGGFDERYFLYLEDVELSLRARMRGYSLWCAAEAVIRHRYQLNLTPKKFYWLERNRLLTLAKCYAPSTLQRMRVALLLTRLVTWTYAVGAGPSYRRAHREAGIWMARHREEVRRDRWKAQQMRRLSDAALLRDMTAELKLQQVLGGSPRTVWLERVMARIYRRLAPHEVGLAPPSRPTPTPLAEKGPPPSAAASGKFPS